MNIGPILFFTFIAFVLLLLAVSAYVRWKVFNAMFELSEATAAMKEWYSQNRGTAVGDSPEGGVLLGRLQKSVDAYHKICPDTDSAKARVLLLDLY